jgi:hypothetical protein
MIPSSPRKKPAVEIVLPHIPEGVQVETELLGHLGSLSILTMMSQMTLSTQNLHLECLCRT